MRHLEAVPNPEPRKHEQTEWPISPEIIRICDQLYDMNDLELAHMVLDATVMFSQVMTMAMKRVGADAEIVRQDANVEAWS